MGNDISPTGQWENLWSSVGTAGDVWRDELQRLLFTIGEVYMRVYNNRKMCIYIIYIISTHIYVYIYTYIYTYIYIHGLNVYVPFIQCRECCHVGTRSAHWTRGRASGWAFYMSQKNHWRWKDVKTFFRWHQHSASQKAAGVILSRWYRQFVYRWAISGSYVCM